MQVFAGHVAPVVCGEFTPDGTLPSLLRYPSHRFSFPL